MNAIQKIFRLCEIKYRFVLLLSMATFVASFSLESTIDMEPHVEMAAYGLGFAIALIWSILNYMGHLRLNALYQKHHDIHAFVARTNLSGDDKAELLQYLGDFVKDLEDKGDAHDVAVQKAIGHFQVREFSQAQGGDLFEKPSHDYLFGYAIIFAAMYVVIRILDVIVQAPFALSMLGFTFLLFSIGLFGLYFLYKLLDVMINKK